MQGIPLLYGSTGEILTEKSGNLNLGIPGIMYVGGISGIPCIIARWIKVINVVILFTLLMRFAEINLIVNKELTADNKEKNYAGNDFTE